MALGPLFIPRKDNLAVPKTTDPGMERFLNDLYQRVHTNELAIQRWANAVPRLAAVMGTGSAVAVQSTGASQKVPLDGTVNAFFPNVVDKTNNVMVIPANGWYTISGTVFWTSAVGFANRGNVEVNIYKNANFAQVIGSSGTDAQIVDLVNPGVTVDYQNVGMTNLFSKGDKVEFDAFNAIFLSTGGGTTFNVNFLACTLDFLGPSPTAVQ